MAMSPHRSLSLAFFLLFALPARAAELRVLVDGAADMPMARFEQGRLVEGVHKDLGDLLAANLGRDARYVILPRKRIARALQSGEADILCGYVPEWLEGSYLWSRPLFTAHEVVITDVHVPRPQSIEDLRGQPIGTILGYAHPEMEKPLGAGFVRDNAPNMEVNIEKLARGRVHHILIARSVFSYRMRLRSTPLDVYPPLPVMAFPLRCAVSPKAQVSLKEVDQAIARAESAGRIAQIERWAEGL